MKWRNAATALARDKAGVSATEFALIAPVFLTLLIGIFDAGQEAYAISVLNGAVQKAARDSSLEVTDLGYADAMVEKQIGPILPGATFESKRTSYNDYADIGRPEKWNDANNDGTCSSGESYVDENGSGEWESDIGKDGNGGADDVVVYEVTVNYEPTFKVPLMPGHWNERSLTASAIKKNQPFANQTGYGSTAGIC
ncbi:TadE/TadG family type IV pilus assembly protein [Novosphingobium sp. B 225]|uniref:TadE/TadG family type IV pilus assembly protein n=1 Tax=Novosphingobium sp. B 225 TaxID=1961849 RepID=UPI000B4C18B7|nr:TadE family protein [Novosphingobium sp. B 225]